MSQLLFHKFNKFNNRRVQMEDTTRVYHMTLKTTLKSYFFVRKHLDFTIYVCEVVLSHYIMLLNM